MKRSEVIESCRASWRSRSTRSTPTTRPSPGSEAPATPIGSELALFKIEHQSHALELHEALLGARRAARRTSRSRT